MQTNPPPPPEEANTLPHDRDAEEAVIGSVLIDPESFVYIQLDTDDFYIHRHRFIWAAMVAIRANGQDIDHLTVSAELEKRGQLVDIGGTNRLLDMISRTPNVYHVESYADIIRNTAVSRRYVDLAGTIAKQAMNGGVDEAAAIEALTSQSKGERDGRHISEGLEDLEAAIMERRANPVDVWGIPTGFIDLDKRTGGPLHKQQLLLLSGESGTGKTTFLLQSALHAAKQKHGVAIFEKEMSEPRTLRRLIEIDCGVPNRAMLSGHISDEQLTQFKASKARIKRLPIFVNDDPGSSTVDIRGVIARARTQMDIDAIYLDYLGLLADTAPGNANDYDQTKAMRFRELCRELDLAGFAIQDMVKHDGFPNMQTLSGGAKVRFGADNIYIITQDDTNPTMHYLTPAKERDGDSPSKFITLMRPGLAFKNAAAEPVDLRSIP